jgi:hypothetical protein
MMNGVSDGIRSAGNGAVMNLLRRCGETGMLTPASLPTSPDQQPAAITTTGASKSPWGVRTLVTLGSRRSKPMTGCSVLMVTPSSRARAAIAVVTR